MKAACWGLILIVIICVSAAGVEQHVNAGSDAGLPATDLNRVVAGVQAPDFTLETSDNKRVTLSSYRDKKNVVLVFYRGYW